MLETSEKAYCLALHALKEKQYQQAAGYFDRATEFFAGNPEFNLLRETTRLLLEVKTALAAAEMNDDSMIVIEEIFTDG